ncbi:AAWKG family protein [Streptomyces hyaluromycini]|uniref:AAWKG family protein n=1 Tax=Streptomyces hyaluromycini TaxID=1377993 RepID=UPI000B5CE175|nr:AAWKG family protein [Streptomyces hyaluromycini]
MSVDNWEHIINLMTGFTLGERDEIMGVKGDGGIPWLAVDIKKKPRDDRKPVDQWFHNDGMGAFIQFYSGTGQNVQKYEANVTFTDQTAGRQYWQRSSDALRTLVQPPYKSLGVSSAWGGSPSLDNGVDLASFTTLAKSFDNAGTFFTAHAETLKQWTESLGDENAAWKGKAAGVFYDLVNNLHDKYETFKSELTPPGFSPTSISVATGYHSSTLHGDSLIGAEVALHTALSNMYDEFMRFISKNASPILVTKPDGTQTSDLIDGDSRNVLNLLLLEVMQWVATHNVPKVHGELVIVGDSVSEDWSTDPDYSDTTVWGNLKDSSTWSAIANEAQYRWRTNIETNLDAPARTQVATLQQSWSRVLNPGWNTAFSFEDKNTFQPDSLTPDTSSSSNDDINKINEDLNKSLGDLNDNLNNFGNNLNSGLNNIGDGLNNGLNNFGDNLNNSLNNIGNGIDDGLGNLNNLSNLANNGSGGIDTSSLTDGNGSGSGLNTGNLLDTSGLNDPGTNGDISTQDLTSLGTNGGTDGLSDLANSSLLGLTGGNTNGSTNLAGGTDGVTGISSLTNPDGSVTTTNPDGSITTEYPDGTSTTVSPTGEVTTTNPDGTTTVSQLTPGQSLVNPDGSTTGIDTNGDITTHFPDGSSVTHNADGSVTSIDADGNKTTTLPNGVVETTTPDGLTQLTAPDGAVSVQNADGSLTTTFPDGSSTTIDPNGTVTTTNANGSTVTSHLADGQKLVNPDGSTTTLTPDGGITTTYPDGSSVTVNPDGTVTSTTADGTTGSALTDPVDSLTTSTPITTTADPSGLTFQNGDGSLTTTYPTGTTAVTDPSGYTTTTFPDGSSTVASPDGQFQSVPSPSTAADGQAVPDGTTGLTTAAASGAEDPGLSGLSGLMSPMMMLMGMSRAGGQGQGQGQGERVRETYLENDDDGAFLAGGPQRPQAAPPDEVFEEEDEDPVDLPSRTATTGQGRRGGLVGRRPGTEDSGWTEPEDVWGTGEEGLPASLGR